ncbi:hypothetical protein BHE74_00039435 [Ensete ventricosum]|nr:hypothetical protein BHE74_00039435 [Ensete ventricosum]
MSLRCRGGATVAVEGVGATGSDCGNKQIRQQLKRYEGSNGKGGGSGVVRSVGSSRQRLRMRQQHREKQRGGTEEGQHRYFRKITVTGKEEGMRVPRWQRRVLEIVYPCIPDPDGEDEGGQASSSIALQPDNGPRSSLGIGLGLDDVVGHRREFARRFTEGIRKLAGSTLGDYRKKIG